MQTGKWDWEMVTVKWKLGGRDSELGTVYMETGNTDIRIRKRRWGPKNGHDGKWG